MASYSVLIRRSAGRELAELPLVDRRRVVARIERLADDPRPHGCEKLSGQDKYRVRQGDSRVLYEIDDQESSVTVVKVARRRDVYR